LKSLIYNPFNSTKKRTNFFKFVGQTPFTVAITKVLSFDTLFQTSKKFGVGGESRSIDKP